jgi:hypothetical protein
LTKRDAGSGCGLVSEKTVEWTEILLSFRDKVLSFESSPIDSGKEVRRLLSRMSSVKAFKLEISSGTAAKRFADRSSFSNLVNDLLTTDLGILARKFRSNPSCLSVEGS